MKQSNPMVIGLTGGIATGKSTISKILKDKGYPVIDADIIAREVVEIGKPAYNDIVENFGGEILNSDKNINREKLGSIIFKDKELRFLLNEIVHPRVYLSIKETINKYINQGNMLIFVDIPLLIEVKDELTDGGISFDEIWLIYATKKIQIERLRNRNNYTAEEATIRIDSQMPIGDKIKYCDRIIDNTKDLDLVIKQIENIISEIIKE